MLSTVLGATVAAWASSLTQAAGQSAAPAGEDPILGTWTLSVAKSRYSPGPAPKSQTRIYEADRDGMKATITTVEADRRSTVIQYTADYNRLEYRITGSTDFDTIALQRINAYTSEATLMHAGKEVGMARRVISMDGRTLTITLRMTNSQGQTVVNNVEVLEKQSK